MTERSLRIFEAGIHDRDGVRYWRVTWDDQAEEGVTSLYLDETYQERIAPRLRETWTLREIYELEQSPT